MKKIITKLHITFLFTFSVLFSQNISLSGKITDSESGDPLVGANVIIDGNGLNTGAATDSNGDYSIDDVTPGSYKIKVSYIGYADLSTCLLYTSDAADE